MFETQTLPGLGPWLSNCRNVILTAHSPCWPGLDITLTVYFCTTCTERNILCKREQRAPQAKGVTQFTMHCMARGEGRTMSVKLQITLFGAVTFARKLTSCYCSHLASLWLVSYCQYLTLIVSEAPESLRKIPGRNEGRAGCKNMSVWMGLTNPSAESTLRYQ